jgi:hypothetical protein
MQLMPEFGEFELSFDSSVKLPENNAQTDNSGYYGGESLKESHSVSEPPLLYGCVVTDDNEQILSEPLTTWTDYMAKSPVWADLK